MHEENFHKAIVPLKWVEDSLSGIVEEVVPKAVVIISSEHGTLTTPPVSITEPSLHP